MSDGYIFAVCESCSLFLAPCGSLATCTLLFHRAFDSYYDFLTSIHHSEIHYASRERFRFTVCVGNSARKRRHWIRNGTSRAVDFVSRCS